MAASPKPPTTLKISIQTVGTAESIADLFTQLGELGFLERSQDIVLNVGYYFEDDGRAARDKAAALLRDHPAVLKTKSFTDLGTKQKISDTFEIEPAEGDDDEDGDETPLERWEREQAEQAIGESLGSVESVTLSARGRTVTLTAETGARAAEMLRRSVSGE